jgi:hypothetical protein
MRPAGTAELLPCSSPTETRTPFQGVKVPDPTHRRWGPRTPCRDRTGVLLAENEARYPLLQRGQKGNTRNTRAPPESRTRNRHLRRVPRFLCASGALFSCASGALFSLRQRRSAFIAPLAQRGPPGARTRIPWIKSPEQFPFVLAARQMISILTDCLPCISRFVSPSAGRDLNPRQTRGISSPLIT